MHGSEGGLKVYVVNSDLSRKAEPGRLVEHQRTRQTGRRHTFHGTGLIDRELEALFADLNMCFGGKGDAAEEQVELTGGAGDGGEDGGRVLFHVLVHGGGSGRDVEWKGD